MKPRVTLIAAIAKNNVIGKAGKMPWHLTSELKNFKATTLKHAIIMGHTTFKGFNKPLPDRYTIVLSRQAIALGIPVCHQLSDAIKLAEAHAIEHQQDDIFIAGGSSVYQQAFEMADRLLISRIDLEPDGDSWFPALDLSPFEMIHKSLGSHTTDPVQWMIEDYRRKAR